jgi:valyl-tRNA synthetase
VYIATRYEESFGPTTEAFFRRLASASEVVVAPSFPEDVISAETALPVVTDAATIFLPLSDLVDTEKERARLENEEKRLNGEIERLEKKLSNQGFLAKAPAAVVDAEKEKLNKYRENLAGVTEALNKLR